jgi:ADP-heptose:LPS heptosyltransferase
MIDKIYNLFFLIKLLIYNILIKLNLINIKKCKVIKKKLKIIIFRNDAIGDLILSIPSFFMIKKMYPYSDITLIVNNYNIEIVRNLPYINNCWSIDKYTSNNLTNKINNLKPDVIIALWSNKYTREIIRNCNVKIKIGPISKIDSFYTFNYGVVQNRSKCLKNEAQYNLDLIKFLNHDLFLDKFEINTQIYYNKNHEKFANDFLKENNINYKKFIIIHPTNNKSCKNIKFNNYVDIIKVILKNFDDTFIIISGILKDKEICESIIKEVNNKRVISFINEKNILYFTALIHKCTIFIGTSTGPLHIASALKKNLIGIYSIQIPTTPKRWGAFDNNKAKYILLEKEKNKGLYFNDFDDNHINEIIDIMKNII